MHKQGFRQLSHIDVSSVHMFRSIPVLAQKTKTIAHDSVKRLLERQPHHTEALYNEAKRMITHDEGVRVIDDSTLGQTLFSSDQHGNPVREWEAPPGRTGINLISTIWTDGSATVSVDFRINYPDKDGQNKNDHFRYILRPADE